jgi:hypothetical protein
MAVALRFAMKNAKDINEIDWALENFGHNEILVRVPPERRFYSLSDSLIQHSRFNRFWFIFLNNGTLQCIVDRCGEI